MKLKYTILYVHDVARSLTFYEQAFGLTRAMLHAGGDYGELMTGATKLAFATRTLMSDIGKHPGVADPAKPCFEIAFETDDVQAALTQALAAGATLVQKAESMPWGQTISYVNDPDGFLIEICSPVDPPS